MIQYFLFQAMSSMIITIAMVTMTDKATMTNITNTTSVTMMIITAGAITKTGKRCTLFLTYYNSLNLYKIFKMYIIYIFFCICQNFKMLNLLCYNYYKHFNASPYKILITILCTCMAH